MLGRIAFPADVNSIAVENGSAALAGWLQRGIWDANENQGVIASAFLAFANLLTPFANGIEGQVLNGAGMSGASTLGWVAREKFQLPGIGARTALPGAGRRPRVAAPANPAGRTISSAVPRPGASVQVVTRSGKKIMMTET